MKETENIRQLHKELLKEVSKIEEVYIRPLLISSDPNNALLSYEDFKYPVKSYMILCHAAMEEFAELLAIEIANAAKELYLNRGIRLYEVLAGLQSNYGQIYKPDKSVVGFETSGTRFKKQIESLHSRFSGDVDNSHGVGLKYLKFLFYSANIDITTAPHLMTSLRKMQDYRGEVAHKFMKMKAASMVMALTPDGAKEVAEDCITIMQSAAKSAIDMLNNHDAGNLWANNYNGSDIY